MPVLRSFNNRDVYVIWGYSLLDLQKELGKEQDRALYLDVDNKSKIDILSCNYLECNMDARGCLTLFCKCYYAFIYLVDTFAQFNLQMRKITHNFVIVFTICNVNIRLVLHPKWNIHC